METLQLPRPGRARSRRTITRIGLLSLSACSIVALAACSDDDGDDDDASDGTVLVDEDFPGDSLDAACARLEGGTGEDQTAIATDLLDELIEAGGEELAVNTLEQAVVDACPDWADAVTEAIESRT